MKKKLMMVAVLLGALTLGACVDDNESASVTAVREAKAKQLTALATKAEAEAEAALISANAEKAYKEALVKYQEALVRNEDASTEQIQEAIRQSKEKFDAEIEAIKAEYDKRMWEAKEKAIIAEQSFLDKAETRLQALYLAYSSAAESLSDLKQLKADEELSLVRMQAYALQIDEYISQKTAEYEAQIKVKEASIAAWQEYGGLNKSELSAQLENLKQEKYTAFSAWEAAKTEATTAQDASDKLLALYNHTSTEASTVKAVAAIQKYYAENDLYTNYPMGSDWDAAWQKLEKARSLGLIPNNVWPSSDGTNIYLSEPCMEIYVASEGQWLPCIPIAANNIILSESDPYLSVPSYSVSNLAVDFMTKYYAENVENTKNYLGVEATATTEATGLYKTLADAQNNLTELQEALPAKEAEVVAAETKVEDAKALVDAAQLDRDKAQAAIDVINAEIAGYNKEYSAAQREIDAANEEKYVANNKKANATSTKTIAQNDKTNAETAKAAAEAALENATTDAEKEAIQAQIDASAAAIATATATIERADKQIKEAEAVIKTADATIKAETDKQMVANDKIAAANLKLADANEVLQTAIRAYRKVETEWNLLNSELTSLNNEVTTLKSNIDITEKSVAAAKDDIEDAKKSMENNDMYQALWNEVVAALTADYQAEVKALATNEAVKTYITAYQASSDANAAYTEINAKIGTLSTLIAQSDVYDPASEISTLELAIAGLKKDIEELKQNYFVGGENADKYANLIAWSKAEIEELEGKIEVQTEVVSLAKKRVDDYISSQK
nr:hypothetical protein [uncultured Bacteroides sp.]